MTESLNPRGEVWKAAVPLNGSPSDFDPLLKMIGDAPLVLIGEASHGTHEFYRIRAQITKRLIQEKSFNAVAVEADWPDAYRINRYVKGMGGDADATEALADFKRFPAWMWRNADVLDFVGWLRTHNDSVKRKTGFYGLDLYSLYTSIEAVLKYLQSVDPDAAKRARRRYECFSEFREDTQRYGYEAGVGLAPSCEDVAVDQLKELQSRAWDLAQRDGKIPPDEFYFAEQNARLIRNAEQYYRSMFHGRVNSWNLRDRHMAETLFNLWSHLGRDKTKIVVWEHNSHLGDARATDMGDAGELNVGQIVRETVGRNCFLLGFTTYAGSVTAASNWDGPAERKTVRPALPGSYEALFHRTGFPAFFLPLRDTASVSDALREPMLERAIGVIYRPETERMSHYFHARLSEQFDAVLHFDQTRGVEPLERTAEWETDEPVETYPFGV